MQFKRGFFYAGAFLIAVGGIVVAADLGAVDTATLTDIVRLWPLVFVLIGLGLVLRRSGLGLPVGIVAAVVPGLVLGSALAVVPRFVGDCGGRGDGTPTAPTRGVFDGPASVSVRSGCGTLAVTTGQGNGWALEAGSTTGRLPSVESSAQSLAIGSNGDGGWTFLDAGRDTWNLTLPTSPLDEVSLIVTAAHGQVRLDGAQIERLALRVNASNLVVDVSGASVANLSGVVNVGSMSIQLPADSDITGSLRVGGGQLLICARPGVGVRVTSRGLPREITVNGLEQTGSEWQSLDYASATHRADLDVHATFGAVEINPIGGCS